MNREIKFRGKRKDNGQWVKGSLIILGQRYLIIPFVEAWQSPADSITLFAQLSEYHEVIPETVGQYTGLKDKNGKEIYEGDIVHSKWVDAEYQEGEEETTEVTYEQGAFCLTMTINSYDPIWFEVIGNIHEEKP